MPLENKKILIEQQNFMCLVILLRGKQSRRATFFFFHHHARSLCPSVFLCLSLSVCLSQSVSLSLSLSLSLCLSLSLSFPVEIFLFLSLIHMHTQIKNFTWTIILLSCKRRERFFTSRVLHFLSLRVLLWHLLSFSVFFFLLQPLSPFLFLSVSLSLSLSLSLALQKKHSFRPSNVDHCHHNWCALKEKK